jgi:hypothetical protein
MPQSAIARVEASRSSRRRESPKPARSGTCAAPLSRATPTAISRQIALLVHSP